MARTDYYLKSIPPELWAAVKARVALEGRSIRWVILRALHDWVAGRWRPDPPPPPPEVPPPAPRPARRPRRRR